MSNVSLLSLVQEKFDQHLDRTAVVFDDGDQERQLAYSQLLTLSSKVRAVLESIGCKNQVVGLCVQTDECTPAIILGILRSGASFYNFTAEAAEFTYKVLMELHVRTLIVHNQYWQVILQELVRKIGKSFKKTNVDGLRDYVVVTLEDIKPKWHGHNLAYCITTSGTTGSPKVVRVPDSCIVPNILHLRDMYLLTCTDCVFLASPLTFDPCIVEMFSSLSVGACLLIVPPSLKMQPDKLLDIIYHQHSVSVIQATPALLMRFRPDQMPLTLLSDNSPLRVLALGGEKFPACSIMRKLRSPGNKTTFYNLYGTTEVSSWAMCYKVTEVDLRGDREVPLGDALLGTTIQVLDRAGNEVKHGTGMMFIGGTERQCIIGDEEAVVYNKEALVLRTTGDIVRREPDGALYYVGREDFQMKRNGRRLDLEEISQVAWRHMSVQTCVTIPVLSSVVLFVVLQRGSIDMDAECQPNCLVALESIRQLLTDNLPEHSIPDDIVDVAEIPITAHGKVDRDHLEQVYRTRCARSTSSIVVTDLLEQEWKRLLSKDTAIQDESNFITDGGNSLKAVHLQTILEDRLKREMPEVLDILVNKTFSHVKTYLQQILKADVTHKSENSIGTVHCGDHNKDIPGLLIECQRKESNDAFSKLMVEQDDTKLNSNEQAGNDLELFKGNFEHGVKVVENVGALSELSGKALTINTVTSSDLKVDRNSIVNNIKKRKIADNSSNLAVSNCCISVEGNVSDFVQSISRSNKVVRMTREEYCKEEETGEETLNGVTVKHDDGGVDLGGHLEAVWKYNTGKCVDASPLLAVSKSLDNVVYIGSHSHKFVAISMTTGECKWEITLPDRVESSACLSLTGQFVVVGCYDGHLYVLESRTGDIWWDFYTGSEVKCSPTTDMVTGHVFVGSHSQSFYCVDVKKRIVIWEIRLDSGSIFASPVVSYDPHVVIIATLGGKLFALSADKGQTTWMYDCKKPVFSSPVVHQSCIYVGCTDQCLYCLTLLGELKWEYRSNGPVFSSPAIVTSTKEYFCNNDDAQSSCTSVPMLSRKAQIIYPMQQQEQEQLPIKQLPSDGHQTVVCDNLDHPARLPSSTKELLMNDMVVFGSHDSCVYCLSLTGNLVWKVKVESQVYSTPFSFQLPVKILVADQPVQLVNANVEGNCTEGNSESSAKGNSYVLQLQYSDSNSKMDTLSLVVFASTAGTLYIVNSMNGQVLCRYKLKGEVFSSPVVHGDRVVVGCRDDFVYCFCVVLV